MITQLVGALIGVGIARSMFGDWGIILFSTCLTGFLLFN